MFQKYAPPWSTGLRSKQCNQAANALNFVYAKQYIPCWGLWSLELVLPDQQVLSQYLTGKAFAIGMSGKKMCPCIRNVWITELTDSKQEVTQTLSVRGMCEISNILDQIQKKKICCCWNIWILNSKLWQSYDNHFSLACRSLTSRGIGTILSQMEDGLLPFKNWRTTSHEFECQIDIY
jgi:hypothetical protein